MWCLPSYKRPEQCQQVIDNMVQYGLSTPGVIVANSSGYENLIVPDNWSIIHTDKNIGCVAAMNLVYSLHPNEPWYGLVCDDEYVYSNQFDLKLIKDAGHFNIAHGNFSRDPRNGRIWTYVTVGGDLVRACGWWAMPRIWHSYHDNVQELIARTFGLKRLVKEVITEHKHYTNNKLYNGNASPLDETYLISQRLQTEDSARYAAFLEQDWPALKQHLYINGVQDA